MNTDKDDDKNDQMTPDELVKKHMREPEHHVTDEEMENLVVGVEQEDTDEEKTDGDE